MTFRGPGEGKREEVTEAGERRAWLEHLIDVCGSAAADLEQADDAHNHRGLIRDIHELRGRLKAELDDLEGR